MGVPAVIVYVAHTCDKNLRQQEERFCWLQAQGTYPVARRDLNVQQDCVITETVYVNLEPICDRATALATLLFGRSQAIVSE